ncbi:hypothetical protein O0L34_g13764 [Tuta absoluta]|nr:hypothetical protein O0L34_g13764 [Tuta absoluta]
MAAAAKAAVIGFLTILCCASGQRLEVRTSSNSSGICLSVQVNSMRTLQRLRGCVVIVGNLRIVLMEGNRVPKFFDESFPELREVTGYMLVYRVKNLESLSQLFPNLARIRGRQLINNYGLVVSDVPHLKEVGLYSLLKIDRGGVVIWGTPHTCYIETVDWNAIAPNSKHILTYPDMAVNCHYVKPCKCGPKGRNHCWNSRSCQKSYEGSVSCHPECLGCTHESNVCSVCRHYTHRGRCILQCPPETILLPDNQYCITADECKSLDSGFVWNQTCLFDCPIGYEKLEDNGTVTCVKCYFPSCRKVCGSLTIHSLSSIQQADGCVRIKGSLSIHVSSVPRAIDDLRKYLKYIEIVSDYVYIYSSIDITSLDFLSNLKQIAGRNLKDNTYSIMIQYMKSLRELFSPKVMKDLQIDRGKLKILNNPVLCMNKINELEEKFVVKSNETDIPPGLNGYSGDCDDFGLYVEKENETAATILFSPKNDSNINHYTVLLAKIPAESQMDFVPELCSKSEWFTIHPDEGRVLITSLHPASTYAVCIEALVYSKMPLRSSLARSPIVYFTMPFVKPEPPFILEIVSTSPNAIHLQWVDHRDYRRHITSYQLDLILIDIPSKDVSVRDHCKMNFYEYYVKEEFSRHVLLFRPPLEYKSCENNCRTIIPPPEKFSLVEDHFDVCNFLGSDCDAYEEARPKNSSLKKYVNTLALNIPATEKTFRVEGLAPFRDYKIRLRSCAKNKCSRSTRAVIRTRRSQKADIPSITLASADGNQSIYIKWEAAEETNGPVFMYFVQMLPDEAVTKETLADSWCVYPEERSLIVKSQVNKKFQVRVCSSTLGSFSACSEWKHVVIPEVRYNLFLWAIAFSITMTAASIGISVLYFKRQAENDAVPLVDMTSLYRSESEPPVVLSSDFMPFYSVPLNDALVN